MPDNKTDSIGVVTAVGYLQSEAVGDRQADYDLICFRKNETSVFLGLIRLTKVGQGWDDQQQMDALCRENNYAQIGSRIRINGGMEGRHPEFTAAIGGAFNFNYRSNKKKVVHFDGSFGTCKAEWELSADPDYFAFWTLLGELPVYSSSRTGICIPLGTLSQADKEFWEIVEEGFKAELDSGRAIKFDWEKFNLRPLTEKEFSKATCGAAELQKRTGYFDEALIR